MNRDILKMRVWISLLLVIMVTPKLFSQSHALVIGVDGLIASSIDYASTPGIDKLINNGTYTLSGYGSIPSTPTTGWASVLTGVSPADHQVLEDDFQNNNFAQYPSIVSRYKSAYPSDKVASIVRNKAINDYANIESDLKFNFDSDTEVIEKAKSLLSSDDITLSFVQLSGIKDVGDGFGYQLRSSEYVNAVQSTDELINELIETVLSRPDYLNENWVIYMVSTHGGTEAGLYGGGTPSETIMPIVLSGNSMDNMLYTTEGLSALEGDDNAMGALSVSDERSYVRVNTVGTDLEDMSKFTVEAWIKAGENTSDPSIIGDKNWGSGGNPGFTIFRSGSNWRLNIANTDRDRYDYTGGYIEDGAWHHIAVVFDKTGECILYHDGKIVNSFTVGMSETASMKTPYDYLCIGQEGSCTYGSTNWEGEYNEVRIWTDLLDQETIVEYMNIRDIEDGDHPNLSKLALYLKMDEASGEEVADYSENRNNGQVMGNCYRVPIYSLKHTDIFINLAKHLTLDIDASWGIDGREIVAGVPYRLFKVNN